MICLFVCAGFITSCDKDDDDNVDNLNPKIDFVAGDDLVSSDTKVEMNAEVNFDIRLRSNDESGKKLETFEIRTIFDNATKNTYNFNEEVKNEKSVDLKAGPYTIDAYGVTTFEFKLVDKDGMTTTKSFKITCEKPEEPNPGVDVAKKTGVKLGADASSFGSFYSTKDMKAYSIADAKAISNKIDLCFYFNEVASSYTIAAIDEEEVANVYNHSVNGVQTWDNRLATRFSAATNISAADFDAIGEKYVFPEDLGTTKTKIADLKKNGIPKVYYFKTTAGERGLIKIVGTTERGKENLYIRHHC